MANLPTKENDKLLQAGHQVHIILELHGWKFKIFKILNFRNTHFKPTRYLQK